MDQEQQIKDARTVITFLMWCEKADANTTYGDVKICDVIDSYMRMNILTRELMVQVSGVNANV